MKEATSLGLALTPPEDPLGPDDLSRFDVPLDSAEESGIDPLWSGTNKNRDVSTGPLARPFARTAHSFACSGLLASLAPSATLTHLLARSLRSLPRSWESELLMSQNDLILSHSVVVVVVLTSRKTKEHLFGGLDGTIFGRI